MWLLLGLLLDQASCESIFNDNKSTSFLDNNCTRRLGYNLSLAFRLAKAVQGERGEGWATQTRGWSRQKARTRFAILLRFSKFCAHNMCSNCQKNNVQRVGLYIFHQPHQLVGWLPSQVTTAAAAAATAQALRAMTAHANAAHDTPRFRCRRAPMLFWFFLAIWK
jgi:hypothetical protein